MGSRFSPMRRAPLFVVLLSAASVLAQEPTPPPLPTPGLIEEPPPVEQPRQPLPSNPYAPANAPMPVTPQPPAPAPVDQPMPTYAQRCFGYPSGAYLMPIPHSPVIVTGGGSVPQSTSSTRRSSGSSGGTGSGGSIGGGGGGDGKAFLIIAVVVVALLPVVVYALDADAPPIVQQRHWCPSLHLDLEGGLDTGVAFPGPRPFGQGRLTMAMGVIGGDVSFDLNPSAVSSFAAHGLLRILPKQHVELAVAAGYRRNFVGNQVREGFEIGIPHRYAFWRDDLRMVGLELRPSLIIVPGSVDAMLEGSFIAPVFELLHLRLGARVYSFGNAIVFGGTAGLTLGI